MYGKSGLLRKRKLSLYTSLFIIPFLCVVGLQESLIAETADAGHAAKYLRLGVGARALGMGKAFVSVVDDASAAYWNPAALSRLEKYSISSMYANLTLDRYYNYVGLAANSGDFSGAVSWLGFGVKDLLGTDEAGNPTGTFNNSEYSVIVSSSYTMLAKASIGVNAKLFRQAIADYDATGYGVDIGLLLVPMENASIGIVVQDIGSSLKWDTGTRNELPLVLKGGVSYKIRAHKHVSVLPSFDVTKIRYRSGYSRHYGIETIIHQLFAVRAGYQKRLFSYGWGVSIRSVSFDYAFTKDVISEKDCHYLSVGFNFI